MARVEIGRCYSIVRWAGVRLDRRGRRVGGYTPRDCSKIGTLHELNMPLLDSSLVAPLLAPGIGILRGYALAGVFWQLVSQAANTPLPGTFVRECSGRLVAIADDGMARLLRLTAAEWCDACEALLPHRGVGALDYRVVTIDVADELAGEYEAPSRQLELPLGAGGDGAVGRPAAGDGAHAGECAPTTWPGAHMLPQPGEGGARVLPQPGEHERDETNARDARTDVTRRDARATPHGAAPPDGGGGRRTERAGAEDVTPRPPSLSNNDGATKRQSDEATEALADRPRATVLAADEAARTAERAYRECLGHVRAGAESSARMAFVASLANTLGRGVSGSRDRREWGRAFTVLWERPRDGQLPSPALRLSRVMEVYERACVIGRDPGVERPAAVFHAWLVERGVLARRDGAQA
jgi:hypothetical protein